LVAASRVRLWVHSMIKSAPPSSNLPLSMRKANLERLWHADPKAYSSTRSSVASEIGPDLFRAACRMGLEGLVLKRRDRPYQAGRSKHWIKVKNRRHPAMDRVMDAFR
jgi:bifunctional non-homologous end joining protein LigD